jgi:hypothetical protein
MPYSPLPVEVVHNAIVVLLRTSSTFSYWCTARVPEPAGLSQPNQAIRGH